jgi:hypothetical protein
MLNHGLSLSDQYWMRAPDEALAWERINYFDNPFSDDLGRLLSGAEFDASQLEFVTPDNTSDGMLQKYWTIVQDTRCLLKKGSAENRNQEPYNEVLATELHARLLPEGSFVPYTLATVDGTVFSSCPEMLNNTEELVPAQYVRLALPEQEGESALAHYLRCTRELGIQDAEQQLAWMFATDFLLANSDRHLRNYGVIRNVEDGSCRMAPIFDTGRSLWCGVSILNGDTLGYRAKSFEPIPERQAAMLRSHLHLDLDKLDGFSEYLSNMLLTGPLQKAQNRAVVTYMAVTHRINTLRDIQEGKLDHPAFIGYKSI